MYVDFKEISDHVVQKLEGLSPMLSYHSVDHVFDVLEQTQQIAAIENIVNSGELLLLQIASLYHDAGFLFAYKGHEEVGCEIARNELPGFGLKTDEINQVCGMIMATKIPQSPQNKLEEIICDADLDYLGRDDFFPIARRLYEEMLHYGFVQDEKSWNIIQKNFLQQHHYFTKTNQERRSAKKQEHLEIISKLLDPYSQ